MKTSPLAYIQVLLLLCMACPGKGEPKVEPFTYPTASTTDVVSAILKDTMVTNNIPTLTRSGSIPLPRTVYNNNLPGVLGTTFELVLKEESAKKGKDCRSLDPSDFEDLRLFRPARQLPGKCQTRIYNKELTLQTYKIKSETMSKLSFIFGELSIEHDSAFELVTTEVMAAEITNAGDCLEEIWKSIRSEPSDELACDVLLVHQATLMQINWKLFKKIDPKASGGYGSLVKINTELYQSTDYEKVIPMVIAEIPKHFRSRYNKAEGTLALRGPRNSNRFDPPNQIDNRTDSETLSLIAKIPWKQR